MVYPQWYTESTNTKDLKKLKPLLRKEAVVKKFAKGTTTLLATALVLQSTPIVQAASYSPDRSNQLSVFGSTSTPSLSTQAVYECLTLYQQALQDPTYPLEDLEALRQNALLALDFLDNLPSRPSAMNLEQVLSSIALIRQLDERFPIYQPHMASWPKNPNSSSTSQKPNSQEFEPIEIPSLSLLEASHQMESTTQSQVVKKTSIPIAFSSPSGPKDSISSSSSTASSSLAPLFSQEADSSDSSASFQEPSQAGPEERPNENQAPSEVPFEDVNSSDQPLSQEPSLQESISTPQVPIPALQEEPFLQETLEPALQASLTAAVIIDGTQIDERITAWLNEDPSELVSQSFEDSTNTDSFSADSIDESHEPASTEPSRIQTIEPVVQEPSVVEEMPSEESFPEPIVEEPALIEETDPAKNDSSENQAENTPKPTVPSTPAPIQETKPTTPSTSPQSLEPVVKEEGPTEIRMPMEMEEEVDLAPIEESKSFSIFDYIQLNPSSSLLEAVYPGLGIGPLPHRPVAALPVLFKDDLNQNPQHFEDADDVSTEGRPQKKDPPPENIQGIPEYFEEMDEDSTPSTPDTLPPLPSDQEEEEPKDSFAPAPSSDKKDPLQKDPLIVDVSDKDLGFDLMPDFDPSIISPAPANPLLPDPTNPTPSTPSSQDQLIVDSWASAPTVSTPTPTLSQSITVRQLNKQQNRRLKIANMGIITLLPNYEDSVAWKKSASPYNTPLLWGQCTWFAWGRFYDLYGFSPGFSGNGYDCVSQLLQVHSDKFELSKTPASGAVFSSDVAHNHVGIVLDYDAEKDLLTIQEGNLDGISNSNWDEAVSDYRTLRLSSRDIRTLYGDVTYAIPKKETKFVGYEETEKALAKKKTVVQSEKKTTTTKDTSQLKNLRALCFSKLKALLFIPEEMEEIENGKDTQEEMETSPINKDDLLEEDFEWMED